MCYQSRDGCRAGLIRSQDLAEKDPQRDQRRVDPVFPAGLDRYQRPPDRGLREDVAERQFRILEVLASQECQLLTKSSLAIMDHPWGLLTTGDLLPNDRQSK